MKKIIFVIALVIYQLPTAVFGQAESNYADFKCITYPLESVFRGSANAVCKLYWNESRGDHDATGVLVNNTNRDGKYYVLTAAHNLPEDSNGNPKTKEIIDSALKNYQFEFFYERTSCDQSDPVRTGLTLVGAKLAGIYSEGGRYQITARDYLLNTDIALLELLEKPNLEIERWKQLYFAGWNANVNGGLPNDVQTTEQPYTKAGILISHTGGFPKKITLAKKSKKRKLEWAWDVEAGKYFMQIVPTTNEAEKKHWIQNDTEDFYNYMGFNGIPTEGSSGAPFFNQDGNIFSIKQAGIPISGAKYSVSTALSSVWLTNSQGLPSLKSLLSPDIEANILELDGCYPCAAGNSGLSLEERNRYLKKLSVSETISGDKAQSFVAQDEIQVSSTIRPGARISFNAEQVLLNNGTNFEPGSDVEITSGSKNGLSCVTGCYGMIIPPNPGYFFSKGSFFTVGIENAKMYSVKITLANGKIINRASQPVQGATIKLFELLDLNVDASTVKNTTATVEVTFTNDCDTAKKITLQAFFNNSLEDNAFLSDYYHYRLNPVHGSKMPSIAEYMAKKKALTQWYQPAASFQPALDQYPEDVVFEIGIERDITFATASGYEWNFRGRKGYRSINPAITSGNGESSAHHTQIIGGHQFVSNGALKMDIYYPKLKTGVTATQAPDLPVICYVFGGGYVTHDQPELGAEICRWFARKGYIVAFIDYRIGADLTNKEISKRAPMRAWQDVNAAVQFLRMQGQKPVTAIDKWRINPNKIFGNGWSAGAIACLHNVSLNKTQYQNERIDGNFLEYTKGGKAYTSLEIPYFTYNLDAYPTIPCKPGETNCTGSTVDAQFNAVGVFAGAIGKPDWINNLQRPAIDIHHQDDEIVLWGEGTPFKNVSPKTNFVGLTQVPPLYGGGYLKANYPNKSLFDVVTLDKEWEAGGKPKGFSLGKHHAAMIKWGDVAGVDSPPRLEIKEMFLLDGFFMNQSSSAARMASSDANLNANENQDQILSKDIVLYPNPSNGKFELDFYLKEAGLVSFKIADINGKLVFKQKNNRFNKGDNKFSFDLTNELSSGLYFLKVTCDEFSKSLKISIK